MAFFKKQRHVFTLLLALASIALYLPTLGADFVWDARAQILIDTFIHQPHHLLDVLSLRVLGEDVLDNNRPTNLLSLMLDSLLWGQRPFGYHLTNIVLHAATVLLLLQFIAHVLRRSGIEEKAGRWLAALAALLFAVHPLNCEPVSEVSYREDLLVAFFTLAALNFAARFTAGQDWKTLLPGCSCVLCLLLAVGAKESGIAGPCVLAAYWWLWRRSEPRLGWLTLLGVSAFTVGGFLAARFALEPQDSTIFVKKPPYLGGSLLDAALIQPRIWTFYLRQVVLPQDFCADYGAYSVRNFNLGISMVVLVFVVCLQVVLAATHRVFALGAILFWAALLPVSNFVPIFRPMADRFLYLPMVGIALMLADLCRHLHLEKRTVRIAAICLGPMTTLVLAGITFQREKIWHDEITLWRDTSQKNPASITAADNLGWALLDAGRPNEAIEPFQRAVQLSHAEYASPFGGLALAFEATDHSAKADEAFRKAVALDARYADPQKLVAALSLGRRQAQKLELIARRNTMR